MTSARHGWEILESSRHSSTTTFTLIRDPASTGRVWEVAEFYVTPISRRMGVGREAIASIWSRFPSAWELQVHARNTAAVRFWASCIQALAQETPQVTEVEAKDGKRLQFNFRVGQAS